MEKLPEKLEQFIFDNAFASDLFPEGFKVNISTLDKNLQDILYNWFSKVIKFTMVKIDIGNFMGVFPIYLYDTEIHFIFDCNNTKTEYKYKNIIINTTIEEITLKVPESFTKKLYKFIKRDKSQPQTVLAPGIPTFTIVNKI